MWPIKGFQLSNGQEEVRYPIQVPGKQSRARFSQRGASDSAVHAHGSIHQPPVVSSIDACMWRPPRG
jgi:hypothetical protein